MNNVSIKKYFIIIALLTSSRAFCGYATGALAGLAFTGSLYFSSISDTAKSKLLDQVAPEIDLKALESIRYESAYWTRWNTRTSMQFLQKLRVHKENNAAAWKKIDQQSLGGKALLCAATILTLQATQNPDKIFTAFGMGLTALATTELIRSNTTDQWFNFGETLTNATVMTASGILWQGVRSLAFDK